MKRLLVGDDGGGAVSVPMAIASLAMITVLGMAVDGVRAAQGIATAEAIAAEAARAGVQAVDTTRLAAGIAAVDPTAAVNAARAYLNAVGAEGTVQVELPDRITVEVAIHRPTVLLALIGRNEIIEHGSAQAQLVTVPPRDPP